MGTRLQQALRILCFNTDWKYAIFWKLRHEAQMILALEDAYYSNHEGHGPPQNVGYEKQHNLSGSHSDDLLGLAVADMSYHVYSFGEGIVGQVAVSGKHVWTFPDRHVTDCLSLFEHNDGWQVQFLAGVKTVVLVAVVPHGVIQLGSLNTIPENMELVNYIRDAFSSLLDSSIGCNLSRTHCDFKIFPCLSDICAKSSTYFDCQSNLGRHLKNGQSMMFSRSFSLAEKSASWYCSGFGPSGLPINTVKAIAKDEDPQSSLSGGGQCTDILQSRSGYCYSDQQKQVQKGIQVNTSEGDMSCFRFVEVGSNQDTLCDFRCKNKVQNSTFPATDDRTHENQIENVPLEFSNMDPLHLTFKFSTGCELYKVLGSTYQRQSNCNDWDAQQAIIETTTEMTEGTDNCSLLTADSGSEHLLEAVVANACYGVRGDESEKLSDKLMEPSLTTEKLPQQSCDKPDVNHAGYPIDESLVEKGSLHCLSSEVCGASSSRGFSSRSHSTFSEHLGNSQPPPKINKKRARPSENCRPRPRDRQLIQDRIRELRELVPNGAKCSIDSLLERTVKHMLFMQGIIKHADKLKCTEPKLHDNEAVARGLSGVDQGSSWLMEVGSHLKVCPIRVENISMNGQMLIEIVCEECSHFLEIAEAIRSLGMMILKGATDACGKKTSFRFVIEGQNNQSMHRMDILWSLMQILQDKKTI